MSALDRLGNFRLGPLTPKEAVLVYMALRITAVDRFANIEKADRETLMRLGDTLENAVNDRVTELKRQLNE